MNLEENDRGISFTTDLHELSFFAPPEPTTADPVWTALAWLLAVAALILTLVLPALVILAYKAAL